MVITPDAVELVVILPVDKLTLQQARKHHANIPRESVSPLQVMFSDVVWATTGQRIPNMECFERLRRARNAIQHFCAPADADFRGLSLEFIYTVIDPLIASEFGLNAIEFHEDHSVGYDYVVGCLLRRQLRFTLPADFRLTEIDPNEELAEANDQYKEWFRRELARIGKNQLLST